MMKAWKTKAIRVRRRRVSTPDAPMVVTSLPPDIEVPDRNPVWGQTKQKALKLAFSSEHNVMLASFLMGLVGGQRAITPLATVAIAAAREELPRDSGAPKILGHPLVAAGALALAAGELAGDKQKSAPDRIVPIGLAARLITSSIAGASLVSRRQRWLGAALGGVTAVIASYPGWRARMGTIPKYGQTITGFVEDAAVIASAVSIVRWRSNNSVAAADHKANSTDGPTRGRK